MYFLCFFYQVLLCVFCVLCVFFSSSSNCFLVHFSPCVFVMFFVLPDHQFCFFSPSKVSFLYTYSMMPFFVFSLFIFCQPFFLLILFSFLVFLFIGNLVVLTSQHFPRFVLKILLSRISSLFLWWIVIWSLFIPFYTNLTLNTCLSDCLEAATMLYHNT